MTPDVPRAYLLAAKAREQHRTVVMGGYHVSFLPHEALVYADAVVIGFAETAWPRLLRDYRTGNMGKIYKSEWRDSFRETAHVPRRDLLQTKSYLLPWTIEATRGCLNHCVFCTIPPMHDKKYEHKRIEIIEHEIGDLTGKTVALLDSNPFEDSAFSRMLFDVFSRHQKRWFAAATLESVNDPVWVAAAAKSGCRGLLLGFESLNPLALASAGKTRNKVDEYRSICRLLHHHGIAILGCFVFGFDHDDQETFKQTVDFVNECNIDIVLYSAYTPFPGTLAWERLNAEKRILTDDWRLYDGRHAVFTPRHLHPEELEQGLHDAWKSTYAAGSIVKRVVCSSALPFFSLVGNISMRYYSSSFLEQNLEP
jgi:radical SAM superfamily enzyme YgiQ (UPF0313 family)